MSPSNPDGSSRGRIVVCDDELFITRTIHLTLTRAGFDVAMADNGAEALKLIDAAPIDLLVTDCQMPIMSGIELIVEMRERAELADVPVILLTAKELELSQTSIQQELKIDRMVSKPFSPRALLGVVEQLIKSDDAAIEQPAETC